MATNSTGDCILDVLEIRRLRDTNDSEVATLVAKSDEYLSVLYPPESNHSEETEALVRKNSNFYVCRIGAQLVGCCAVKVVDDELVYGEIKRLYVDESQRGKGVATALVRHVEKFLASSGVYIARLEVGPRQPAAVKLYRKLGYIDRVPFGWYALDPLSIFMEKRLRE